ncbi:MAG: hypothetical protein M3N08_04055 [Pseudomonadota bacterium]|nr:hypothetical protein [Pseudomonadota bacterium]
MPNEKAPQSAQKPHEVTHEKIQKAADRLDRLADQPATPQRDARMTTLLTFLHRNAPQF